VKSRRTAGRRCSMHPLCASFTPSINDDRDEALAGFGGRIAFPMTAPNALASSSAFMA
jgi:hypothetical protein